MKRRIIQIVVLLLLGAIVNIAAAWGCAYIARDNLPQFQEISTAEILPLVEESDAQVIEQWRRFAQYEYIVGLRPGIFARTYNCNVCSGIDCEYEICIAGAPLFALSGYTFASQSSHVFDSHAVVIVGNGCLLPLRPI